MPARTPLALPRALRIPLCATLLAVTSGCASWRVQRDPPAEVIITQRPERVRVTTTEGQQLVLLQPRAITGILRGYDEACWERNGPRSASCPEVGFLLSEVEVLEIYGRGSEMHVIMGGVVMAGLIALIFTVN